MTITDKQVDAGDYPQPGYTGLPKLTTVYSDERARFEGELRKIWPLISDDDFAVDPESVRTDARYPQYLNQKLNDAYDGWIIAQQAARSQSAPAAQGAPSGFVLVPTELTTEMLDASESAAWATRDQLGPNADFDKFMHYFVQAQWCAALKAAPSTPQPSAPGEPNASWASAVESYAAAARVIALHLKRFCDESLPYPEMIADAARKAAAEMERLAAQPSADDAPRTGATYFSYGDDNGGFETHATAAEARAAAEESLGYFRDDASEGWNDGVRNVCWGVILGEVVENKSWPATPDDPCYPDCSEYVEFELRDCATPPADARDARPLLSQAIGAMSKLRQALESPDKNGGLYVFPAEAVRKFTDEQARLMFEERRLAASDSDRLRCQAGEVARVLEQYAQPGDRVIWRDAFRWKDKDGVLSNHFESMDLPALVQEFGYEIVADYANAAIVRPADRAMGGE